MDECLKSCWGELMDGDGRRLWIVDEKDDSLAVLHTKSEIREAWGTTNKIVLPCICGLLDGWVG